MGVGGRFEEDRWKCRSVGVVDWARRDTSVTLTPECPRRFQVGVEEGVATRISDEAECKLPHQAMRRERRVEMVLSLSLTPPAPNIPHLPSQQLLSSASESASIDHSRNVRGLAALTSMLALVAARGLSRGLLLR